MANKKVKFELTAVDKTKAAFDRVTNGLKKLGGAARTKAKGAAGVGLAATGFADAINRLQPATKQLIKGADAKAKYNRDLRKAAVNLGLQDEQKFEDRRFNLALKMNDREYQRFLTDDKLYQTYAIQIKSELAITLIAYVL